MVEYPVHRHDPDQRHAQHGPSRHVAGDGPCEPWPLAVGCTPLPDRTADRTPEQAEAVEFATEILWRLTAGRYGLCKETVRPCRRRCLPFAPSGRRVDTGQWLAAGCGCAPTPGGCGCGPISEIRLPGPVHWDPIDYTKPPTEPPNSERVHKIEVLVDGERLNEYRDYTLYSPNLLTRLGGVWPDCQDLTAAENHAGAFVVKYWRGQEVPPGGRRSVALLAWEFLKACQGATDCKLPERVREVAREGITYTMVDPLDFLDNGRTGLSEVDLWLSTVNPKSHRSPSGVWSPDLPSVRGHWYPATPPPARGW